LSLPELSTLVQRIATSSPEDPLEQAAITKRLIDLKALMERLHATDLAAQLGAAALLTRYLSLMGSVGGTEIQRIVHRLVSAVERSFALAPQSEPPTPLRVDLFAERVGEESGALGNPPKEGAATQDMLLGEVLLKMGAIRFEHIELGLRLQRATGARFGEALVQHGILTVEKLNEALEVQERIRRSIRAGAGTRESSKATAEPPSRIVPGPKHVVSRPSSASGEGGLELRLVTEKMLGEVLVAQGVITEAQLEHGLRVQRSTGMRIGEALVTSGAATWEQIKRALEHQEISRKREKANESRTISLKDPKRRSG
jgi:hypothetical protein